MFINDVPIESYGAIMLGTPKVSPAPITSENMVYRNGAGFIPNGYTIGLKEIECNIAFLGNDFYEVQLKRSQFRAALLGKLNIGFRRDRFQYFCVYNSDSELESEHERAAVSKFKFTGVQHEALVETQLQAPNNLNIYCTSTAPDTECIINFQCTEQHYMVAVENVVFDGYLQTNTTYQINGIDKRILKGNTDIAVSFVKFPTLKPGVHKLKVINAGNDFTASVLYYPTHI